jgi:hypothetical protein
VVLGLSLLGLERMKAAETRTTVEGLDQRVHAAQITASQKVDGAKRNVEVSWEGQPESAMLVVNLDYYFGGQRVADGSDHWRTLHGPVLFRRISSSGTAKLEVAETEIEILHRENFWGRLGVYIVPGVSAMVMEPAGEGPGKGAYKEIDKKEFVSSDCSDEFQLIASRSGSRFATMFPEAGLALIDTPNQGFVLASVFTDVCGASLITPITRSDAGEDPPK